MAPNPIRSAIEGCRRCRLHKTATCAVPGEGPADAHVMLVGQAPGREEDKTGHPFVGRAGRFLDGELERIGLDRKSCFITSVVKHFPPDNRMPRKDEVAACLPFLIEQIEAIDPAIVVLMGNLARSVREELPLTGKRVIESVHPAAAMRFTKMKRRFRHAFDKLERAL